MDSPTADKIWTAYELPLDERLGSAASDSPLPRQSDELILQNESWFCSLRWLVIVALTGLAFLGWVTTRFFSLPGIHLDFAWPLAVAGMLSALNLTYLVMIRRASESARRSMLAEQCLWLQIVLDLAVLSVVVHYLGSLNTFAPFMYLFHIVLACIFLPYAQSLIVTLLAMGMYLACLMLETTGAIVPHSVFADLWFSYRGSAPRTAASWQFGSVVFVSGTVWYLASRLSNALRRRDEELSAINRRLAAAVEERARHMLQTTHQLKAPFAAIHANTQLLLRGHCGTLPAAAVAVIEQIAARCEMLSRGIKSMIQLANLRSQSQHPPAPTAVDLPSLIESCLAELKPLATRRSIVFEKNLSPATVQAVLDHAAMIIDNILLNAINYSHDGQTVSISICAKLDGRVRFVVRDRGIGIHPEKLMRIFDDYFRTTEAVKHNHASTGLGLAIVRQTALAGKIGVRVESAPAQGTAISLDFPSLPRSQTN